ncbi:MAG: 3-phosphoshikimate 1-carboxyvinyltransferase [Bdellovibrionota bacterium]
MRENILTLFPSEEPLNHSLRLAGSKSFMNRALILGALAETPLILKNPSRSEDSLTLLEILRTFGVTTRWREEGALEIQRDRTRIPVDVTLDVGAGGTVMRFITAFAASCPGATVTVQGSERMHERPIGPLVDALRTLGAEIEYLGKEGCPPLRIHGKTLRGGAVHVDGSLSSQFLTALLLTGATFEEGLTLIPEGELVSRSYLSMTVETLRAFGGDVTVRNDDQIVIAPTTLDASEYLVEGDASGASYFWALAAITGGRISVGPFPEESLQGDLGFLKILEWMGCSVERDSTTDSFTVQGPKGRLRPVEADMLNLPDSAQTLAVLAAVADGVSILKGLKTLRVKETDRIAALEQELRRVGVRTESTEDTLVIHGVSPRALKKGVIQTYDDHRMAMSFAVLGAILPGLQIENPSVVAKSFPDFWTRLFAIGFEGL